MGVVLALAFGCALVWLASVAALGALREWHHVYLGVALLALGWGLASVWCAALGLLVMADDAWQHLAQLHRPTYRSPLHRLYAWAYPVLPSWLRL